MECVRGFDTYDRLHLIEASARVLTGESDVLIPPGNSAILAERIPKAELLMIPGGGHQIPIEQPQACNQAILGFWKRMSSPIL